MKRLLAVAVLALALLCLGAANPADIKVVRGDVNVSTAFTGWFFLVVTYNADNNVSGVQKVGTFTNQEDCTKAMSSISLVASAPPNIVGCFAGE